MFEKVKNNHHNKFYAVCEAEILEAENDLKIAFPEPLREFYKCVGYGFLASESGQVNRLMDPMSVRDFRLREESYEHYPDIAIYNQYEDGKIIFFEVNETVLFSIGVEGSGSVFYYDKKIAANFSSFLELIQADEHFYQRYVL